MKKTFQDVIDKLPSNWIDVTKEGFKGHIETKEQKLGYYAFEVNEELACFYFGECAVLHELLEVLIASDYMKSIKNLNIGTFNESHGNYDYQESVKILSRGFFPKLETFTIGQYDELYNGGMNFQGILGDVTMLLEKMPNLKELELCGTFALKKELNFNHLTKLTLWSDSDTLEYFSDTVSDISQTTLSNFLLSNLPMLNYLELFVGEDSTFVFPEDFLEGKNVPNLKHLDVEGGFIVGEKEKILFSKIKESCNIINIISKEKKSKNTIKLFS